MSDSPIQPELSPVKQALVELRTLRAALEAHQRAASEPIAVLGMGCRFPGANNPQEYWNLLAEGRDATRDLPADRWNGANPSSADAQSPGLVTSRGGYIDDPAGFDAEFFGISPREAVGIDPQHRLLLEVSWQALEDAGCASLAELRGSKTGVFIGMGGFDYLQLHAQQVPREQVDGYLATGNSHALAAGRLSYVLGLQGPSLSVDTACSSSLVAIHLACQSLRLGECRMAITGGVHLILAPEISIALSKAGMLSPDGRCKPFSAAADGFARGEGCGMLVLKRLCDAVADGDRVLAVIRGSAVNQDGRSNGLTAPNGPAQEAVLRAALSNARLEPENVSFIEAHGTGTALGDPIEVNALANVYGAVPREQLLIGSVKSNLGHLESAAGVAGLMKVVLMFQHRQIPPTLHLGELNPRLPWQDLPLRVPTSLEPLHVSGILARAGVSSFGFGGTNAHVVVEQAPVAPSPDVPNFATGSSSVDHSSQHLLVLSARSPNALQELAEKFLQFLTRLDAPQLSDIAYTAAVGRTHFLLRLAVMAATTAEAARKLQSYLNGDSLAGVWCNEFDNVEQNPSVIDSGAPVDLESLAEFYVRGADIDWRGVHSGASSSKVSLPTYPFQHEHFWWPAATTASRAAVWPQVVAATQRQSEQAPVDLALDRYPEVRDCLNDVAVDAMVEALAIIGAFQSAGESHAAADLIERFGVKSTYGRLVERWLAELSTRGILRRDNDRYATLVPLQTGNVTSSVQRARRAMGSAAYIADYLDHCSKLLADVLTGRVSALETLFPGGSMQIAEDLYHRWPASKYFNHLAAAAVESALHALPEKRTLRVLEIGGGTGGVTAAILPRLAAGRASYHFTDVSHLFLGQTAQRFAAFDFVTYGMLDIERDPAEQGFSPGSYDVVVAANVLHAAGDLRGAVSHAYSLLAPGGLLLLYETTSHPAWFDISIGLIEGWQGFTDELRANSPLIPLDAWRELLLHAGFAEVAAFPESGSPAEVMPQHVIIAQRPGELTLQSGTISQTGVHFTPLTFDPREITADTEFLAMVHDALPGDRHGLLVDYVRQEVARTLRRDNDRSLDRRKPLMDFGIDSLMAVELRGVLSGRLKLEPALPATLIFDHPTIDAIASLIDHQLDINPDTSRSNGSAPNKGAAIPSAPVVERSTSHVNLDELSDADVERLILEKFGPLDEGTP